MWCPYIYQLHSWLHPCSLSPDCIFVLLLLDYILHCITLNHAIYYRFGHLKGYSCECNWLYRRPTHTQNQYIMITTVIQVLASRIAPFYCSLSKSSFYYLILYYCNTIYVTSTVYQLLGYDTLLTLLSVCTNGLAYNFCITEELPEDEWWCIEALKHVEVFRYN